MTQEDSDIEEMEEESSLNAELAQLICNAKKQAGLTQQLADRIGTKQSVNARLEDADYEGHSLSMLQKIVRGLNQRLEVKLVGNSDRTPFSPFKLSVDFGVEFDWENLVLTRIYLILLVDYKISFYLEHRKPKLLLLQRQSINLFSPPFLLKYC